MSLVKRLSPFCLGSVAIAAALSVPALRSAAAAAPAPAAAPATAPAAAPVDPVRAKLEADAEALFQVGEDKMKVSSYDDAIVVYGNVRKRYPDTIAHFKAESRMADALVALKKEPDAIALLNGMVKEDDAEWSPKALIQLGDIYVGEQKYAEAFRSYNQVVTDYPDSPSVDRAYYAIGSTHFHLGHFIEAAAQLEKVGTSYASRNKDLQRVSPGEPLQVRITEPNLVADQNTTIDATLTTTSGDREPVKLRADVPGGDRFRMAIPTELGTAKPGDGILQLHGSDTVTMTYKARYVGQNAQDKTVTMGIASNARVTVLDSQMKEVKGVVMSDTVTLQVEDPDRDLTDAPDTVMVTVTTKKKKDSETVKLTETGPHTGIFRAQISTKGGDPVPGDGIIETNAPLMEGSATQYDDSVDVSYVDELNLMPSASGVIGPNTVVDSISLFKPTEGVLNSVDAGIDKADLEIQSLIYQGRSLNQIAGTYRDLGQEAKGAITFRKAIAQFQTVIDKYPNAPDVEDAMYGLFQSYVGQDEYDSAIAVITQIAAKFPQSSRASQALFELASLHVQREEYDQALGIYQSLVQRAKGTQLAEDAEYAIATTYMLMLKPKAGDTRGAQVTRDTVIVALQQFVHDYPESERTPEVLFNLVKFRYDGNDYDGVVSDAGRMVALYPDNVNTGRVMLLEGQAQAHLRHISDARATFTSIMANYGSEADQAQKLLTDLNKRYGTD